MTKRVVEHEIKLEISVKIILGVLTLGVLLNAFAPVLDVREALAGPSGYTSSLFGGSNYPVHIICKKVCN
jgi:hypothetical protein